jgi:hypothetical protein
MREWLEKREGETWTTADTARVVEHIRKLEAEWNKLASRMAETEWLERLVKL